MKHDQSKQRMHKDLIFLTQIKKQVINQKLWKYPLEQVQEPQSQNQKIIKDITNPCAIYFGYKKYDYQGKFVTKVQHQAFNHPPTVVLPQDQDDIYKALTYMKCGEKAWFNIVHKEKGSKECDGFHGYNYEIFVQSVKYKNQEKIESKRLMYNMNRNEGKKLFSQKKYSQASKVYENSVNIFSNPSKKLYSQQQIDQITSYKYKSEINYLRCVCKMKTYDEKVAERAGQISKEVLERNQKLALHHYLRAGHLRFVGHFGYAFQELEKSLKLSCDQKQKQSIKNYIEIVKECKQRNIRHIKREEIRKKKTMKSLNDDWDSHSDKSETQEKQQKSEKQQMHENEIKEQKV